MTLKSFLKGFFLEYLIRDSGTPIYAAFILENGDIQWKTG